MMQKCIFLATFLFACLTFGQKSKPKEYSKIKFVYEMVSNYHLDEKGIYADTLLLQKEFKKNKYIKQASPEDPQTILGFIPYDRLTSKEKKRIASSIFHNSALISGEYDKKTNTTLLQIIRKDNDVFKEIKKHLQKEVEGVNSTVAVNYTTRQYASNNENYSSTKSFEEMGTKITYVEKNKGFYAFQNKHTDGEMKVWIDFREDLPTVVLPDTVFLNNTNGVNMISTVYGMTYLKSVSYE